MEIKVNDGIKLQQVILQMDNPQCELALIHSCAGICKINNTLRTSPTKFISNSINKYDSLRKWLEEIFQSSLDEDSWCQATLPIREGGLGIISACNIAPAAYLSSVSQAISFISNLSISLDIDGILKNSISKIISLVCINAKEILDERIGL